MSKNKLIETIRNEALRENTDLKELSSLNGHYIGDTREAKIIEKIDFQPSFRKHIIHLQDEPVSLKTFVNFDPEVKNTAGYYTITYIPKNVKWRRPGKPFMIGQDLVRIRVQVSGYKDWKWICNSIPELAWVDRWCPQLCKKLFDLAARHPGTPFYFSPDWISYAEMIEKKAAERGIDLNNKPFVAYACEKNKLDEINKSFKLAPKNDRFTYESVLEESRVKFTEEEE